jgi:hypothetical protein
LCPVPLFTDIPQDPFCWLCLLQFMRIPMNKLAEAYLLDDGKPR